MESYHFSDRIVDLESAWIITLKFAICIKLKILALLANGHCFIGKDNSLRSIKKKFHGDSYILIWQSYIHLQKKSIFMMLHTRNYVNCKTERYNNEAFKKNLFHDELYFFK